MENSKETSYQALHIITNAGYGDSVVAIARQAGAAGATIMSARGEGARHEVFMGITLNTEKEVVLLLVSHQVAEKVMLAVKEKAGRTTPAHSICYTLPVTEMLGVSFTPQEEELT